MPKKYLYIDESGDLGLSPTSSKYMILVALVVSDPKHLDRAVKNIRRKRFRKVLSGVAEIKANSSSDLLRGYMLEKLNGIPECQVCYIILKKDRTASPYLKSNKDKLYNFVAGKLAQIIVFDPAQKNLELDIKIDKSKGKQLLREDFNQYISRILYAKNRFISKIEITHGYSHSWSGLQFADMLAWACFQKYERDNSEFLNLIKVEQHISPVW
jgi:hypothetical protein